MASLPTQPFLGLRLLAMPTRGFMAEALAEARNRTRRKTIAYLNAATVNLAFESDRYARLLNQMDFLYADGKAVVWGARWLKAPIPERINAGDFTTELMRSLADLGLKLALIGGRARHPRPTGRSRAGRAGLFQLGARAQGRLHPSRLFQRG